MKFYLNHTMLSQWNDVQEAIYGCECCWSNCANGSGHICIICIKVIAAHTLVKDTLVDHENIINFVCLMKNEIFDVRLIHRIKRLYLWECGSCRKWLKNLELMRFTAWISTSPVLIERELLFAFGWQAKAKNIPCDCRISTQIIPRWIPNLIWYRQGQTQCH